MRELLPFALAAQELYTQYENRPDPTKIVQIGRVWLTWGDFRLALNAMAEAQNVAQVG